MHYPKLRELDTSRSIVDIFRGYNHNLQIGDGEFFDMKNMTSDYFPILAPRGLRNNYKIALSPQGMIRKEVLFRVEGQEEPVIKDTLCYVDEKCFVADTERIDMNLDNEPKQLISMGSYVIILPDKKYINTMDFEDRGSIDASAILRGDITVTLCSVTGCPYENTIAADNAPENPQNLDLWIDTSSNPHTLKKYSKDSAMWVAIPTTYVKISATGIGKDFKQYDGVTISGIVEEGVTHLNGSHVLYGCGEDFIIIAGILDKTATFKSLFATVSRSMPNMDYVVEHGNRLWGCRYGKALNGEMVNEIYASKLGDFKNWNCFMGISTDSWVGSCGTDGPFTGAVTYMDHPLFFKENCVHKVYGNYPANMQIQTTTCRGVQKGCDKSLAIVNEVLFYKSVGAVCAYDGSMPVEVSGSLGNEAYSDAVSGSIGNKYYISMKDSVGEYHLFVYDVMKGLWHREDNFCADAFCSYRGELYAIERYTNIIKNIRPNWQAGSSRTTQYGGVEKKVKWMAQTGIIGTDMPDRKYISKLTVRMSFDIGTRVSFLAQYDSMGGWEHLCTITGTNLRSFSIPVRPRRCDHLRLRIEGEGDARIYSIVKTIEQGSDAP